MSKEQLAGLVEEMRRTPATSDAVLLAILIGKYTQRLAAILATLPEPGVVSDEVARVAVNAYDRATGEGWQMPCVQGMRSALEAALPYLAPAAPAGEVVAAGERLVGLVEGPGCLRWEDGQGFRLKDTAEWSVFYVAIKHALAAAAKGVGR